MIPKDEIIRLFKKEFDTTTRVLKALPAEKMDFKPHERSSDAKLLTSTFVFEMYLMRMYVFGDQMDRSVFKNYQPADMKTIINDFEKETRDVIARLEQLPESDLNKIVDFGGGKFRADEYLLMILFDQIHHRGQLSVYIRMAGGKVPSIYGPSADDKGTNLN
ncbi:MAG TPA: DinB family protein [Acidobacteriota bacterium]|jgi:uncharacterized damage-inducible protein DinB|nr:DinB family protein [Acidobacteriota bacterium]